MTKLSREIIKKAKCNVVDITLKTSKAHREDLARRLKSQEKALVKTVEKGWMGQEIIEQSIVNIKSTLAVL